MTRVSILHADELTVRDGRATSASSDVVLIEMPTSFAKGVAAMAAIRKASPRTPVVMLVHHAASASVERLLDAGAAGYVLRHSPACDLLHALQVVAAGGRYLDPVPERTVPDADLSPREEEVLRLVAWGYSNKEIAAHLCLSVKTVESHKNNVGQKFGLRSRIDIVRFALTHGWFAQP